MMNAVIQTIILALILGVFASSVSADRADARCDIYPAGEGHTDKVIACTFSQRQGHITISRADGVTHDLSPVGDTPGNYTDQGGRPVYRQSGMGDQGTIFRFPDESLWVYRNTAGLEPQNNYSEPFSTVDYDATARVKCRAAGDSGFGSCPAGVLRMEGGQGSVVIQNQLGEQFTINFMAEYINATNRTVDARLDGDTWIVTINDEEVYQVPQAFIEGG